MTATRLLQEPDTASYGERIAHLVHTLVHAGLRMQPALPAVELLDGTPWRAPAPGILIVGGHARVPLRYYLVRTAMTACESPLREHVDEALPCLSVRFDLQAGAELILALDELDRRPAGTRGMPALVPLDDRMSDVVLRLLQALRCPLEARVLGPGIVRELLYRVLTAPQGAALYAALSHEGSTGKIGKALRRIRERYAEAVDVAALAHEAGMSVAAFHAHFKLVTQTTPIQLLKTTRLQQARLLMMREGVSAAQAARLVGYESKSQFSREFKRLFGRTPAQEAARTKV